MVSIFGLFRKRSKRSPPSTPERTASSGTAAPARKERPEPARFASLRHRPKVSRPSLSTSRRASSEAARRAKPRASGRASPAPALPRLDLDFARPDDGRILDIDVSGHPDLSADEVAALEHVELDAVQVAEACAVISPELARRGVEVVGVMLPGRLEADPRAQRHLQALLALTVDAALAPVLPTVAGDDARARFLAAVTDAAAVDLADVLRWALRRLARRAVADGAYVAFVREEHAASYPANAYAAILGPLVPPDAQRLLGTVFELVAAVAVNAATNTMSAGRLAHLLGWSLVECPKGPAGELGLYGEWRMAGQRLEHLFYAWVRWQSTTQKLPRRLLQLVQDYPFGQSSASAEHLPLPPPSSFPRKTLHLVLASDVAKPYATRTDLLDSLLGASVESGVSAALWGQLRERAAGRMDELVQDVSDTRAKAALSAAAPAALVRRHTRRRSASTGQLPQSESGLAVRGLDVVGEEPGPSTPGKPKRASLEDLRAASEPQWSDFAQTGFTDTPAAYRDLSLAVPEDAPAARSPRRKLLQPPRIVPSTAPCVIVAEETVELDDGFDAFMEDIQGAGPRLPPCALFRLNPTLAGDLEWLWLTSGQRAKPREEREPEPSPKRPLSPGAMSVSSRLGSSFGLRDLTANFRRSTSSLRPGMRRSLFGSSHRSLAGQAQDGLAPVAESIAASPAMSSAPTDYTVGEMGELVKIPSIVAPSPPRGAPSRKSGIAATPVKDWRLLAEGGKHVVVAYRGADAAYAGKVLRLRKEAGTVKEDAAAAAWQTQVLPRLLGPHLIVASLAVTIEQQWLDDIAAAMEPARTAQRRASGPLPGSLSSAATLMPDLTASTAQHTVTIEIKPKWGFLPTAEHLTPPESVDIKTSNCRFCLHQYLRGEERNVRYCPLDLYSLDKARMSAALAGLWEGWQLSYGAKNNLLVFVQGKKAVPSDAEPLLDDLDALNGAIVQLLLASGALAKLAHLQATLDPIDITGLAARFRAEYPDADLFDPLLLPAITDSELADFAATYERNAAAQSWTLRQHLIAYVLSAIFKDCSIMIQVATATDPSGARRPVIDQSSVKVVDLDLKPIHNLRKWYDLDEQIWRYWAHNRSSSSTEFSTDPATPSEQPALPLVARPQENSSTRAVHVRTPMTADNDVEPPSRPDDGAAEDGDSLAPASGSRRLSLADALDLLDSAPPSATQATASVTAPVLVSAAAATAAIGSLAGVVHELMDHGQPLGPVSADAPEPASYQSSSAEKSTPADMALEGRPHAAPANVEAEAHSSTTGTGSTDADERLDAASPGGPFEPATRGAVEHTACEPAAVAVDAGAAAEADYTMSSDGLTAVANDGSSASSGSPLRDITQAVEPVAVINSPSSPTVPPHESEAAPAGADQGVDRHTEPEENLAHEVGPRERASAEALINRSVNATLATPMQEADNVAPLSDAMLPKLDALAPLREAKNMSNDAASTAPDASLAEHEAEWAAADVEGAVGSQQDLPAAPVTDTRSLASEAAAFPAAVSEPLPHMQPTWPDLVAVEQVAPFPSLSEPPKRPQQSQEPEPESPTLASESPLLEPATTPPLAPNKPPLVSASPSLTVATPPAAPTSPVVLARSPRPEPEPPLVPDVRHARSFTPSPSPHIETREIPPAGDVAAGLPPAGSVNPIAAIKADDAAPSVRHHLSAIFEPASPAVPAVAVSPDDDDNDHITWAMAPEPAPSHPTMHESPRLAESAVVPEATLSPGNALLPPRLGQLDLGAASPTSTPSDFATPSLQAYVSAQASDDDDYFTRDAGDASSDAAGGASSGGEGGDCADGGVLAAPQSVHPAADAAPAAHAAPSVPVLGPPVATHAHDVPTSAASAASTETGSPVLPTLDQPEDTIQNATEDIMTNGTDTAVELEGAHDDKPGARPGSTRDADQAAGTASASVRLSRARHGEAYDAVDGGAEDEATTTGRADEDHPAPHVSPEEPAPAATADASAAAPGAGAVDEVARVAAAALAGDGLVDPDAGPDSEPAEPGHAPHAADVEHAEAVEQASASQRDYPAAAGDIGTGSLAEHRLVEPTRGPLAEAPASAAPSLAPAAGAGAPALDDDARDDLAATHLSA